MMASIYNPVNNQEIIDRIQSLTSKSKALWGKMTVDQMLAHCHGPIDVAFGDLQLKTNFFMQLIGKMFKNKILNANSFKKNSPTVPDFIKTKNYDFEKTKSELIVKIKRFSELGENAIQNKKHPFFGQMSALEWDKLQLMHLDHHLKQFGV